jgi:hypothetical protein
LLSEHRQQMLKLDCRVRLYPSCKGHPLLERQPFWANATPGGPQLRGKIVSFNWIKDLLAKHGLLLPPRTLVSQSGSWISASLARYHWVVQMSNHLRSSGSVTCYMGGLATLIESPLLWCPYLKAENDFPTRSYLGHWFRVSFKGGWISTPQLFPL